METNIIDIELKQLPINSHDIFLYCGYTFQKPTQEMVEILEKCWNEVLSICRPRFGYRYLKGYVDTNQLLLLLDHSFNPGKVIANSLSGCNNYLILVSTVGPEFDKWIDKVTKSGDIMKLYFADAIGSYLAEKCGLYAYDYLEKEFKKMNLKLTNSYSPGYCDWFVQEQKGIFSLLPTSFCGITLNDSALMHPIKSISSVIGVDSHARKRPYGCQICKKLDCFLRIARTKNGSMNYSLP